jgi:hypothetical protein
MMAWLRFLILVLVKCLRYLFYPTTVSWIGPTRSWRDVRLVILLNHTSLFEFVYAGVAPLPFLWQLAHRLVCPVADETLNRPLPGAILRILGPRIVSISRQRDETWERFLELLSGDSILVFMPEGRMKRLNGLDKHGRAMTVRGGILEILERFRGSQAIFAYSAGLHHVFPPGAHWPKIFKRLNVALEQVSVTDYLDSFENGYPGADGDIAGLKRRIARDLEARRDRYCPTLPPAP